MRITQYTDYSLRVLIFLGLKGEGELATIGEVAARYGISRNHLMKVVQELNTKGYLLASRGKGGGLQLSRPAEEINVGALVRDMEQDMALVECFSAEANCVISPACQLKVALRKALEAFLQVLDSYSLADLLTPSTEPELIRLLGMKPNASTAAAMEASS